MANTLSEQLVQDIMTAQDQAQRIQIASRDMTKYGLIYAATGFGLGVASIVLYANYRERRAERRRAEAMIGYQMDRSMGRGYRQARSRRVR